MGLLALLAFHCCGSLPASSQPTKRPNIILMMADDMGWADVGFEVRLGQDSSGRAVMFDGTTLWETPNLNQMAASGLTFSRMYSSSPVCSPTRASVLTGRSPERIGIRTANSGRLENREVTVAEYAQALGYTTGHFGKWHLGVFTRDLRDANRGGKPGSHDIYSTPLNSGFEFEYSTESKTSTYHPATSGLTKTTRYWTGPGEFVPLDSPGLQGDDSAIIARETNDFIARAASTKRPFLAVCWFHAPHKPLNTPGNQHVDNLEAYRFAMSNLDAAVGSIRDQVQQLGIAGSTLLFFTADNGPEDGQDYNNDGLRNNKRELHEGGVRVPGLVEWAGVIAPGTTATPMVTTDYLPTLMDVWGVGPVDKRPLDGTSMVETIFNQRDAVREKTILSKSNNGHQAAMGAGGRYKLISTDNGESWELYDIVHDFGENAAVATSDNYRSRKPAVQAIYHQLLKEYHAWTRSVAISRSKAITGDYQTRVSQVTQARLLTEPPQKLVAGVLSTPTPTIYLERQYATVQQDLTVDSSGAIGRHTVKDVTSLQAGSVVHSFLVHYDPTSADGLAEVTITFEDEILGVIGESALLAASDDLSFGDPNFEPAESRGLESSDSWTISNRGRTISFNMTTSDHAIDEARVLTEANLQGLFVEAAAARTRGRAMTMAIRSSRIHATC